MNRTIATLLLLAASALPAHAQTVAEQYLVQLANQHRAERGLAPLVWDAALASAAHTHALRVLRDPAAIEHQYPGEPDLTTRASQAGAHFSTVAENLAGSASNVVEIDRSWMASPTHRANILNPSLTSIGIAILPSHGAFYAVEDFSRATPTLGRDDIEQRVLELLRTNGVHTDPNTADHTDARATCVRQSEAVGHPRLVIQWDGPDLENIPATVFQQVPNAAHLTAAVGACPSPRHTSEGFSTYRVAILLY